jgi:hypothetical protein
VHSQVKAERNLIRITRWSLISALFAVVLSPGAFLLVSTPIVTVSRAQGPGSEARIGELAGRSRVCQTFVPVHGNLSQVRVKLDGYERQNAGSFTFHLRQAPGDSEALLTLTHDASEVVDEAYHIFEFPLIPDAAGRSFAFCLEAPKAELTSSITAIGTLEDTYPQGEVRFSGMWGGVVGVRDLDFQLGYEMSLSDKLAVLSDLLTRYKPAPLSDWPFYVVLVGGYLVLIYLLIANVLRFGQNGSTTDAE